MVGPFARWLSNDEALRIHSDLLRYLRGCRVEEADDIAQETFFRMLKKVRLGLVIESPLAYARRVAQHVLQENRRSRGREIPLESDIVAPERPASDEELLACLEIGQGALSRAERKLLQQFDESDARGREQIAKNLGISRNALGLRVHQVRSKLYACVKACVNGRRAK